MAVAVGIVSGDVFTQAAPVWYLDSAERIVRTVDRLQTAEADGTCVWDRLVEVPSHAAAPALLELIHDPTYVDEMRMLSEIGGEELDHETLVCPWTFEAACHAAGGAVAATAGVVRGDIEAAFCLTRPPGHQALVDRAGGGCIFNSAAIAAAFALHHLDLERVAVVDLDARHGIGTQSAFYPFRQVLYCSVHQYPLPPGTGALEEVGADSGQGYTINCPLPVGAGDAQMLRCVDEVITPVLTDIYRPQLIIVSIGYSGHSADHSTDLQLTEQCYHTLTRRLMETANATCGGRLLLLLEGGFAPLLMPLCAHNTFLALHDCPPTPSEPVTAPDGPRATDLDERVDQMIEFHKSRMGHS